MLNLSVGGIEVFENDSPLVAVSEQMCIAKYLIINSDKTNIFSRSELI